jgi:F-type H+-transporting ATPase subunit a
MDFNHIFNSKMLRLNAFFAFFFLFFTVNAIANEESDSIQHVVTNSTEIQDSHQENEDKFNIKSFIFHHIGDAHEFTFWGHGESWKGLYLPIILWTDNGLTVFSAKEFKHDDEGKVVVEKKGNRFVRNEGKIYYASTAESGTNLTFETNDKGDVYVSNAKPLNFSITKNVFTILLSSIILAVLFLSVASSYRKREGKAPKGFQSLVEPIIIFVRDDIAKPNLGYKYERYMPYLLTVFFFIWFNNMFGLVPFFPGGANVTGNIAVTFVLATITLIITTFSGNKYYWAHIFKPHVPWWLYPLMVPVEILGMFTKPFALMIRLFANITAGHILVLSLLGLIYVFNSVAIAPVSLAFAVFIGLIELLVAFIQAFIFTILSALFIGLAIEEH